MAPDFILIAFSGRHINVGLDGIVEMSSGDAFFLIPLDWTHTRRRLICMHDSPTVRWARNDRADGVLAQRDARAPPGLKGTAIGAASPLPRVSALVSGSE